LNKKTFLNKKVILSVEIANATNRNRLHVVGETGLPDGIHIFKSQTPIWVNF
jgi:hypothetical protein